MTEPLAIPATAPDAASLLVVKVGGGEGVDWEAVCDDLAAMVRVRPLIVVHGGSHAANQLARSLGREPKFVVSPSGYESRLTDRPAMEIFQMAYCGLVNKSVVEKLAARGLQPIGLSGMDAGLWRGPRKEAIRSVENGRTRILRDSLTGRVARVDAGLLWDLLRRGLIPVLCPPAISDDHLPINVDGDRAAAETAAACGGRTLVILSNVPGLLRDRSDPQSLIRDVRRDELAPLRETVAEGRMKIKLLGAEEALDRGLQTVILADARVPQPLQRALAGQGTTIRRGE